jgi:cysteine sulfinate desulfinase/cysteine desulfurase-like protein
MVGLARAASAVRISLGDETSEADVERALDAFRTVLARPFA